MLHRLTKLGLFLPHIYFSIVFIYLFYTSPLAIGITLALALGLLYKKHKLANFISAVFLMFFSFWMLFSFLSDLSQIVVFDTLALYFLVLGITFTLLNFLMSILMSLPFFQAQMDIDDGSLYVSLNRFKAQGR